MLKLADATGKRLRALWRNELAAVASYEQALAAHGPGWAELMFIRTSHRDAAEILRGYVEHVDGETDQQAGPWDRLGFHAATGGKLADNKAALQALKEGEKATNKLYEEALEDGSLPPECREVIADIVLPEEQGYVMKLERLLQELEERSAVQEA